jgi:hypothetical protein
MDSDINNQKQPFVTPHANLLENNSNEMQKLRLKEKARKRDEVRKPLLNQVNYALLNLHLAGNHNAKPSHDELKEWLQSGQVDVIRMNK